jgi:hypothetical protein
VQAGAAQGSSGELPSPASSRGMYPRISCRRQVLDSTKLFSKPIFAARSVRMIVGWLKREVGMLTAATPLVGRCREKGAVDWTNPVCPKWRPVRGLLGRIHEEADHGPVWTARSGRPVPISLRAPCHTGRWDS